MPGAIAPGIVFCILQIFYVIVHVYQLTALYTGLFSGKSHIVAFHRVFQISNGRRVKILTPIQTDGITYDTGITATVTGEVLTQGK